MTAEVPAGAGLDELLDRLLNKGIVFDSGARLTRGGIDLAPVHCRVRVALTDSALRCWTGAPASAPLR